VLTKLKIFCINIIEIKIFMKKLILIFLFPCFILSKNLGILTFAGGIHDVLRKNHRTEEFFLEYKPEISFWKIYPIFGVMATLKKASYIYSGFSIDFRLKGRFFFYPSLAAGYYNQGKGKDLGFPLEFRSGVSLGFGFCALFHVGVSFYHISNASLGKKNPGEESLVGFISFPLYSSKKYK